MKTAMTISPPSGKLEFVASMSSLDELIECVANSNFDAVELAIRDPKELDREAIKKTVEEFGMTLCVVGTGQSYVFDKLSLSSPDPENRKCAIDRYKSQMEFAAFFGANTTLALSLGMVEEDSTRHNALQLATKSLETLIPFGNNLGVTIFLEPINRYETNFINTLADAAELNARLDNQMKILYDTFHMNIEQASMCGSLMDIKDQLGHVHTADSNRWAPGCGHINFPEIMHCLSDIEYDGYISAEVLPKPTVKRSIEITGKTFASLIEITK